MVPILGQGWVRADHVHKMYMTVKVGMRARVRRYEGMRVREEREYMGAGKWGHKDKGMMMRI